MQRLLFLLTTAILILSFVTGKRTSPVIHSKPEIDTVSSALVLYGKYVYQREKCYNCHMTEYDSGSSLVSLDGLGKKKELFEIYFQLDGHAYMHNNNPGVRIMIPFLYKKNIYNPRAVQLYFQQRNKSLLKDTAAVIAALNNEAIEISKKINNRLYPAPEEITQNKEITALLAFLWQIPLSPAQKTVDSLLLADIVAKAKLQDSIWRSSGFADNPGLFFTGDMTEKIKKGEQLFQRALCVACHGTNGQGGIGPNLTDEYWLHGGSALEIIQSIKEGIPAKGMQPWKQTFSPEEIALLTAYVRSLRGSHPPNAKDPQGKKE